ncbi:MAG: ribonuclease E inhibitor RraB [Microscillaceae bacterium]|nr:ribonuclease E inhibitor RraB [Microscillaceae bacterium]
MNTNTLEESGNHRPVIHYLLFNEEAKLQKFLKKALKNDFRLESESFYGAWEIPFVVGVSATTPTDEVARQTAIDTLTQIAQKLQGTYDSWEYDERERMI